MTQLSFWERSWKAMDPERIAAFAEHPEPGEDPLIRFLEDRGAVTVCDAGCGSGLYALKLARCGFEVSGFDISAEAAAMTRRLLEEKGYPFIDFYAADIRSTGCAAGRFDAALARDVIDHMPIRDTVAALDELLRIVRPGGCVLLTLDRTDAEYESEPHTVNSDGDYLYNGEKWEGMVFHPYTPDGIGRLTQGRKARLLTADERGFTVILEKEGEEQDGQRTDPKAV